MTNIYWNKSTPEDFINIKLGDWVEGVGFVETNFELDFIRSFGKYSQNQREKVLDEVPLKSLKSVIGLAFSFPQLPEDVRNQLIEVDNFYHKVKELRGEQ
jgi:hypothetical protein